MFFSENKFEFSQGPDFQINPVKEQKKSKVELPTVSFPNQVIESCSEIFLNLKDS